jgi:hypothetical protein
VSGAELRLRGLAGFGGGVEVPVDAPGHVRRSEKGTTYRFWMEARCCPYAATHLEGERQVGPGGSTDARGHGRLERRRTRRGQGPRTDSSSRRSRSEPPRTTSRCAVALPERLPAAPTHRRARIEVSKRGWVECVWIPSARSGRGKLGLENAETPPS